MVWWSLYTVANSAQLFRSNWNIKIGYASSSILYISEILLWDFRLFNTDYQSFSVLGYIATLSLGLTVIKKHFGRKTSTVYMLTVGAIPMSLYFSVQQRSYQWSIFLLHFALRKLCCFLKITGRGIALYLLSPLCLPRTTTFTLCLRSAWFSFSWISMLL